MQIRINHYKATKENNDGHYFDLNDYEKFSSVDLTTNFKQFISNREYCAWETLLIGCSDLVIAEKLHSLNIIDITKGLDVVQIVSKDDFTEYCNKKYIPNCNEYFERASIYKMALNEEMLKNVLPIDEIIYCLDLYKSFTTKSIFAEIYHSINFDIPQSYFNSFKDNFLYCQKKDLEIMYKLLRNEFKEEFKTELISEFETGISIIEIQY